VSTLQSVWGKPSPGARLGCRFERVYVRLDIRPPLLQASLQRIGARSLKNAARVGASAGPTAAATEKRVAQRLAAVALKDDARLPAALACHAAVC
jgi:hypothetical protein